MNHLLRTLAAAPGLLLLVSRMRWMRWRTRLWRSWHGDTRLSLKRLRWAGLANVVLQMAAVVLSVIYALASAALSHWRAAAIAIAFAVVTAAL